MSASVFQEDIDNIGQIPIIPSLLQIICQTTGMGFAAIARVTENKWVALAVKDDISFGLKPGGELPLETTLCNEIRASVQPIAIDHVDHDEKYASHLTPLLYGFQSYISVPINRKDGRFFGTLCAIDPKPHKVNNPETIGMFTLYAELIAFHLEALEQLSVTNKELARERKTDEVRDQFIAILGHDLRNPLNAISMSSEMLKESPLSEEDQHMVDIIFRSAARMTGLIENILGFAQARLGNGIILNRSTDEPLKQILQQVILENRATRPDRKIEASLDFNEMIYCDSNRIAELFSNLLGNALIYGDQKSPVIVEAQTRAGQFMLSVQNKGPKIPLDVQEKMFRPFSRGDVKVGQKGLGLGLYIASEIASAHGGHIELISTDEETSFILKIPALQENFFNTSGMDLVNKSDL